MIKVTQPEHMNDTFARVFNTRKLEDLLALYEPEAILRIDAAQSFTGADQIAAALGREMQAQARGDQFTELVPTRGGQGVGLHHTSASLSAFSSAASSSAERKFSRSWISTSPSGSDSTPFR